MTTNEIAQEIINHLSDRSFPIFLTTFGGAGFYEADVLGINGNGYMYEFEIKRSRGDFKAEFKSKVHKHNRLKQGTAVHIYDEWKNGRKTGNQTVHISLPNKYYFACELGLIKPEELPDYCGLVYLSKGSYTEIKPAKFIHKNKADLRIYMRISTILSQRNIYGCSFYTHTHKLKRKRTS